MKLCSKLLVVYRTNGTQMQNYKKRKKEKIQKIQQVHSKWKSQCGA